MDDSLNEMTSALHDIFEKLLHFHAPLKKSKVMNEHALWLPSRVKKSMEECDELKKI